MNLKSEKQHSNTVDNQPLVIKQRKLSVTIKRAKNLKSVNYFSKNSSDSFCTLQTQFDNEVKATQVCFNTTEPEWNYTSHIFLNPPIDQSNEISDHEMEFEEILFINVWARHRFSSNTFLGKVEIHVSLVVQMFNNLSPSSSSSSSSSSVDCWFKLTPKLNQNNKKTVTYDEFSRVSGSILLEFSYLTENINTPLNSKQHSSQSSSQSSSSSSYSTPPFFSCRDNKSQLISDYNYSNHHHHQQRKSSPPNYTEIQQMMNANKEEKEEKKIDNQIIIKSENNIPSSSSSSSSPSYTTNNLLFQNVVPYFEIQKYSNNDNEDDNNEDEKKRTEIENYQNDDQSNNGDHKNNNNIALYPYYRCRYCNQIFSFDIIQNHVNSCFYLKLSSSSSSPSSSSLLHHNQINENIQKLNDKKNDVRDDDNDNDDDRKNDIHNKCENIFRMNGYQSSISVSASLPSSIIIDDYDSQSAHLLRCNSQIQLQNHSNHNCIQNRMISSLTHHHYHDDSLRLKKYQKIDHNEDVSSLFVKSS